MLVRRVAWPTSYKVRDGRSELTRPSHIETKTHLVRHELNQRPVLGIDPSRVKLCIGEPLQAVIEQIELDPFLV